MINVYRYCKACLTKADKCPLPDSHRAQNKQVYAADYKLHKRIRAQFKEGITKEQAYAEVYAKVTDYNRGILIPTDKGKTPFKEIIQRYDVEHIQENSRHPNGSVKTYLKVLKEMLGELPIGSITFDQIEGARNKFKETTGSSNANVNRCFSVCKTLMRRAVEWGHIQKSPAQFLKELPTTETKPRFLTVEEIQRLRACIKDQRLSDYVTVLLHTAIRPINIKGLRWENVDMANKVIHITTHKGRRPRTYSVPMDGEVERVIQRRFKESKGLGFVLDTSNVRKLADQAIIDSKINENRAHKDRFTIYGLKHSYISHLLMKGESVFDVARLVGVSVAMIEKHYGHLTMEHLRGVQSQVNLTPSIAQQFEVL